MTSLLSFANPHAVLLIAILASIVLIAITRARLWPKQPDNRGLRMECDMNRKPRATSNGRQ